MSYKIESNSHTSTVRKEYRSTLSSALSLAQKRAVERDGLGSFEARVYETRLFGQEVPKSSPRYWEQVATVVSGGEIKVKPLNERYSYAKLIEEIRRLEGIASAAERQQIALRVERLRSESRRNATAE